MNHEETKLAPALVGLVEPLGLGSDFQTKDWARRAEALRQRRDGKTLAAVGAAMGVSRERVRQMAIEAAQREAAIQNVEVSPLGVLSARTRHCLLSEVHYRSKRSDGPTPQEVRGWLDSGELQKIPNLGKKSVEEVKAWLASLGA